MKRQYPQYKLHEDKVTSIKTTVYLFETFSRPLQHTLSHVYHLKCKMVNTAAAYTEQTHNSGKNKS